MIKLFNFSAYTLPSSSIEMYSEFKEDSVMKKLVKLIEKTPNQLHRFFLNFNLFNNIHIISKLKEILNNKFIMVAYYNHQRTSVPNFMSKD